MDEKGKKLYTIKSSAYLPMILIIIGISAILIIAQINGKLQGGFKTIIGLMPIILMIAKVCVDTFKNIQVYEKCIIIGKRMIYYEDIQSMELKKKDYDTGMRLRTRGTYGSVGKFQDERFLEIRFKDGFMEEFLVSNYSLKQVRAIVGSIEQYTKCNVSQVNDFLKEEEYNEKKDIKLSIIVFIIGAIILIALGTKIYTNFSNL